MNEEELTLHLTWWQRALCWLVMIIAMIIVAIAQIDLVLLNIGHKTILF